MSDINLPDLPASHAIYSHVAKVQVYTPETMLAYARAAVLADRRARSESSNGLGISPIAFRSSHSVSPSFDRGEHQIHERQIAIAERSGVKADLYLVDMGVLGEIYVKPEVASDRFVQLKRDRVQVKAVYPMYQGAALPNEADAVNPAEGLRPW